VSGKRFQRSILVMRRSINLPKCRKYLSQTPVRHGTIIEVAVYVNKRFSRDSILTGFLRLAQIYTAPRLVRSQIGMQTPHPISNSLAQVDLIESECFVVLAARGMNLSAKHWDERAETGRPDH